MGLSNKLSCEAGNFSRCPSPHRFFQSEVLRPYFPVLEPWVAKSVWFYSCSSWFIHMQMWDHWLHEPPPCHESSLPSCPSPPLLPVWMKVSSLTPWLLDSIQFDFLAVLAMQGGTGYLPMPPSWLEVPKLISSYLLFTPSKTCLFFCVHYLYISESSLTLLLRPISIFILTIPLLLFSPITTTLVQAFFAFHDFSGSVTGLPKSKLMSTQSILLTPTTVSTSYHGTPLLLTPQWLSLVTR